MAPSGSISIMQQIDHAELARLLDEAAEKGAKRALASVGLHDEDAGDDVRELRGLLESWRETKKTVGTTIIKALTTAFLAVLAAGTYIHFGGEK